MSEASNPNDSKPAVSFLDTIEETLSEDKFGSSCILEDSRSPEERGIAENKQIELRFNDPDLEGDHTRFSAHALLGIGANSHVYEVHDRNLQRKIAVKTLRPDKKVSAKSQGRFMQEARVISQLEHPGVLPVHDLRYADSGEMIFSMRKVEGMSLGSAIRAEKDGQAPQQIATVTDKINLIMKICDTLSFAHSKGIFHQDIKPDNIMLGQYGEVIVVDWGTASVNSDTHDKRSPIVGTPAYMSPEQARREGSSASSDIYCLGASFFHLLFGRHTTLPKDPESYWDKKRRGIVDWPAEDERKGIPPRLYAILKKSISADATTRYQSVSDFRDDLRLFLEGQSVTAYHDSVLERSARWYRKNRVVVNLAAVLLIVVCVSLARWHDHRSKAKATWGDPIEHETFSDDSWQKDWLIWRGDFKRQNNQLVTQDGSGFNILYHKKLVGNVAIEYNGKILPGHAPGDLSVMWVTDMTFAPSGKRIESVKKSTLFQVGAYDNNFATILTQGNYQATSNTLLVPGKEHHIRVEIDNGNLRIFLDGRLACYAYNPMFEQEGYIGLYGYFSGKAFDNIKIYNKGVPEVVSVVGIGDAFFKAEQYEEAKRQYEIVIRSHGDKPIAIDARYKLGMALWAMGKETDAIRAWQPIYRTKYQGLINSHQLSPLYKAGKRDQVINLFRDFYKDGDEEGKRQLRAFWANAIIKEKRRPGYRFNEFMALKEELFPSDYQTDFIASLQWLRVGEYERIIKDFPHIRHVAARACAATGQFKLLVDKFPNTGQVYQAALFNLGRYQEIIDAPIVSPDKIARASIALGQHEKVLKRFPDKDGVRFSVYGAQGRLQERLDLFTPSSDHYAKSALALAQYKLVTNNKDQTPYLRSMAYFQSGMFDELEKNFPKQHNNQHFPCYIYEMKNMRAKLERGISKTAKATIHYHLGEIDQVKRNYPHVRSVMAKVHFGEGDYGSLEKYPDQLHMQINALIQQNRDDEIIPRGRGLHHFTQIKQALDLLSLLEQGKNEELIKATDAFTAQEFDFTLAENYFNRLLLPPLMYKLAGKPDFAKRQLKLAYRKYRFTYKQTTERTAQYIAGQIDESEFRDQPVKLQIETRLLFAQAARAIMNGDHDTAVQKFKAYQQLPYWERTHNATQARFVSMMLDRLDTNSQ